MFPIVERSLQALSDAGVPRAVVLLVGMGAEKARTLPEMRGGTDVRLVTTAEVFQILGEFSQAAV